MMHDQTKIKFATKVLVVKCAMATGRFPVTTAIRPRGTPNKYPEAITKIV